MKWYHNSYSEEAIAEMQKEAEERVRKMQSRARLTGEESFSPPPLMKPQKKAFSPLNPENDSLMILALLWLLWNEKADKKLLLALLYILLQ